MVYLVIYDSGEVSREHVLLPRYPSQNAGKHPEFEKVNIGVDRLMAMEVAGVQTTLTPHL